MPPREIDELRTKLNAFDIKGKRLIPFKGLPVMERAFFPGGNGLFRGPKGNLTAGEVLILGSNFGCLTDFVRGGILVRNDETQTSNTWQGLYRILAPHEALKLENCFLTNAWPFLHEGSSNETKGLISSWLADRSLMGNCIRFFEETLSVVQPRLIIALGTGVPAFLAHIWPNELKPWHGSSVASMDMLPRAQVAHAGRNIVCTAITHPSHSNSWQRKPPYQGT